MKGKIDIDSVLKEWPAPPREDFEWEEHAEAILRKARAGEPASESALAAAVQPPSLAREPGEPEASSGAISTSGDRKMSDDKNETPSAPPPSSLSGPLSSSGPRSKRPSLREMAEKVRAPLSTPVPGRTSSPSISTPTPSLSTPIPSSSRGATSTPLPRSAVSTPLPGRAIEAGKDDSGVVNLDAVRSSASAEEKAAAERAKPASEGLFDDNAAPASAPKSAKPSLTKSRSSRPAAAPASTAGTTKGSSGATAGIVIAVLGLAAAFAITQRGRFGIESAPAPAAEVRSNQQPVAAVPAPGDTARPTASTEAQAPGKEPMEVAMPSSDPAPGQGRTGGEPERVAAAGPAAPPSPGKAAAAAATSQTGKPGDLQGEMAKAVGADGKPAPEAKVESPQPASGGKGSSSVPEQPPQGSVSAAVGSVMGGAKACVAGADDVSRATITFSSSGAVSNVSVSGWAAGHGATGCIKSALQGANVGPFSKPSFSVGITIRP